jgi:hypothetical protein
MKQATLPWHWFNGPWLFSLVIKNNYAIAKYNLDDLGVETLNRK